MSPEYSLCPHGAESQEFMFPEYSLCPQRVCPVQLMFPEYSLCPRVQFFSSKSTVYVLRVQFMSIEYS